MIAIHEEIREIEIGNMDKQNNALKNAPHTIVDPNWDRPYSREQAVFPVSGLQDYKFWPVVGRIDRAYGDRNLVCSCLRMDAYSQD